jgi:hypothetical protein
LLQKLATKMSANQKWKPCLPSYEVFHELVTYNRNHNQVEFDFFIEEFGENQGQEQERIEPYQIDAVRAYFLKCMDHKNKKTSRPCDPIRVHWADPTLMTKSTRLKKFLTDQADKNTESKDIVQDNLKIFAKKNNLNTMKSMMDFFLGELPVVRKELTKLKKSNLFKPFGINWQQYVTDYFNRDKQHRHVYQTLFLIWRSMMDVYTIARMLKPFEDGKHKQNILFYGGAAHVDSQQSILKELGFQTITDTQTREPCKEVKTAAKMKGYASTFLPIVRKPNVEVNSNSAHFVQLCKDLLMKRDIVGVRRKVHLHHKEANMHIFLIGEDHAKIVTRTIQSAVRPEYYYLSIVLDEKNEHRDAIAKLQKRFENKITVFKYGTPVAQELYRQTVGTSNVEEWYPHVPIVLENGIIVADAYIFEDYCAQVKTFIPALRNKFRAARPQGESSNAVSVVNATVEDLANMKKLVEGFQKLKATATQTLSASQMSSKRKTGPKQQPPPQSQNEFDVSIVLATAQSLHTDRAKHMENEPRSGWQLVGGKWRHYLHCRTDTELILTQDKFKFHRGFFYYAVPKEQKPNEKPPFGSDDLRLNVVSNQALPDFQPLKDQVGDFLEAVKWAHRFIPLGEQHAKNMDFDMNMYNSQFFKGANVDCLPKEMGARGDGACMIHSVGYCFDVASGIVKQGNTRSGNYKCDWAQLLRNLLTDIEWKASQQFDFAGGQVENRTFTSSNMGQSFSQLPPFNRDNRFQLLATAMNKPSDDPDVGKVVFDYTINQFRGKNGWTNWSSTMELYLLASILCIDFTVFTTIPRDDHRVIDAVKHCPVHETFRQHVRGHGFLHYDGGHFDVVKFTHYPTGNNKDYTAERKQYIKPNLNGCAADAKLDNDLRNFIKHYDKVRQVKNLLVEWYNTQRDRVRAVGKFFDETDPEHLKLVHRPIADTQQRAKALVYKLKKEPTTKTDNRGNNIQIIRDSADYWIQMCALFRDMEKDYENKFNSDRITSKWVDVLWPPPNSNRAKSLAAAKKKSTIEDIRREYGQKSKKPPQPKALQPKAPQPKPQLQSIATPQTLTAGADMLFITTAQSIEEFVQFTIGSYQEKSSAQWGTTEISRITNQPVSGKDLKPLLSKTEWINDNVINAFLRLITRDFTQFVHFEATTTLTNFKSKKKIVSGLYDEEKLMNNGAVAPYWFMPEGVADDHWWLNIVDLTNKWILRCDSLRDDMDDTVLNYLEAFHNQNNMPFNRNEWAYGNIRHRLPTTTKTQANKNSYNLLADVMGINRFGAQKTSQCGVYTCIFGLMFMLGTSFEAIKQKDMNEDNGWRAFVRKSLLMRKLWTSNPPNHTENEIRVRVERSLNFNLQEVVDAEEPSRQQTGSRQNVLPTVKEEEDGEEEQVVEEEVVVEEGGGEEEQVEQVVVEEDEGGKKEVIVEEDGEEEGSEEEGSEEEGSEEEGSEEDDHQGESDEAESEFDEGEVQADEDRKNQSEQTLTGKLTQNNQTAKPPQNNQTANPPQKNPNPKPPQNNQTAKPPQKNQTAKPPQKNPNPKPPQNNQKAKPPEKSTRLDPIETTQQRQNQSQNVPVAGPVSPRPNPAQTQRKQKPQPDPPQPDLDSALAPIMSSIQQMNANPALKIVFHQYRATDPNTDYINMIKNPNYDNALFIFNDNEEQFNAYLKGEPYGLQNGGNNAGIRQFRAARNKPLPNIRVAGIPTGRLTGMVGYKDLKKDAKAKTAIDTSIRLIYQLLCSNQYDKLIIPSSWHKETKKYQLGAAIFGVGDAVKEYIFDELAQIVNMYKDFVNNSAERWVNPPRR